MFTRTTKLFAIITLTAFCLTQTGLAAPFNAQNLRREEWTESKEADAEAGGDPLLLALVTAPVAAVDHTSASRHIAYVFNQGRSGMDIICKVPLPENLEVNLRITPEESLYRVSMYLPDNYNYMGSLTVTIAPDMFGADTHIKNAGRFIGERLEERLGLKISGQDRSNLQNAVSGGVAALIEEAQRSAPAAPGAEAVVPIAGGADTPAVPTAPAQAAAEAAMARKAQPAPTTAGEMTGKVLTESEAAEIVRVVTSIKDSYSKYDLDELHSVILETGIYKNYLQNRRPPLFSINPPSLFSSGLNEKPPKALLDWMKANEIKRIQIYPGLLNRRFADSLTKALLHIDDILRNLRSAAESKQPVLFSDQTNIGKGLVFHQTPIANDRVVAIALKTGKEAIGGVSPNIAEIRPWLVNVVDIDVTAAPAAARPATDIAATGSAAGTKAAAQGAAKPADVLKSLADKIVTMLEKHGIAADLSAIGIAGFRVSFFDDRGTIQGYDFFVTVGDGYPVRRMVNKVWRCYMMYRHRLGSAELCTWSRDLRYFRKQAIAVVNSDFVPASASDLSVSTSVTTAAQPAGAEGAEAPVRRGRMYVREAQKRADVLLSSLVPEDLISYTGFIGKYLVIEDIYANITVYEMGTGELLLPLRLKLSMEQVRQIAETKTVLLIDDQQEHIDRITAILNELGITVLTAESLDEAVQLYKGIPAVVIDNIDTDRENVRARMGLEDINDVLYLLIEKISADSRAPEWVLLDDDAIEFEIKALIVTQA